MMEGEDSGRPQPSALTLFFRNASQTYQRLLDAWTPYSFFRWLATILLLLAFMARIVYLQGWYIVTYALGIYHLNLFIAFLTPKIDPAMGDDYEDGPELPTKVNEEFRPFIRRLPEFKFWYSATKATLVGIGCTFFEAFNVPVFWPILLLYFITLFCITMKRQIKHMLKYRYLPWTHGKTRYRAKDMTDGAVSRGTLSNSVEEL
ncbi:protein RER1 [Ixodes scapularis]|uniref:protein RER1 n=1 Tax=Ixodes scapularis TaxID=6945 RepID=UPI001161BB62|nr:protein RER1 isoform X1 [Ixodes scapularis]XP_040075060.1 protein RER1 [Ixodes scapularis]